MLAKNHLNRGKISYFRSHIFPYYAYFQHFCPQFIPQWSYERQNFVPDVF